MKQRLRILAVDDDPEIRAAVLGSLERDYDVQTADDAAEIGEAVDSFDPQLLILDVMMPGEDGLHALKRLKHGGPAAGLPILMLTAVPEDRYFPRALADGADAWLAKPFTPPQLRKAVKRTLAAAAVG